MKNGFVAGKLFPVVFLLLGFQQGSPWPLLAAVETPGGSSTGTVQGKVLFEGGKAPKGVVITDVIVYLVGEGLESGRPNAADPLLDQKDITFVPHVLPVVAGQKVRFHNNDTILHNVRTDSKENKVFNIAQLGGGVFQKVFDAPEIIKVGCDIHSQMHAYIIVVPNSFFARAAKEGSYTIVNVPPGKYELVGWHETYGTFTKKIEVGNGPTLPADVDFQKPQAKSREAVS